MSYFIKTLQILGLVFLFSCFGDDEPTTDAAAAADADSGTEDDSDAGGDSGGDGDTTSCAASWDGLLYPGYILTLQEGGPLDDGGDIHAFNAEGCYLGIVKAEGSPWYAYGLKTGASQYGINSVEIASSTGSSLETPILHWDGTADSSVGFSLGTATTPTDGNASNTAYLDLGQEFFQTAFTPLFDNQYRMVAFNGQNKIKSYSSGSVQSSCETTLTNKRVGDMSASVSNFFLSTKVFYIWSDESPGNTYGVSTLTPCASGSTTHTQLFSETFLNARPTGVMEIRKSGSAWHQDVLATVGAYYGGINAVYRWHYNGSSWVNQGEPFSTRAHAVTQNAYRTGSFTSTNGNLYTIESDSTNVYLRVRNLDAGSEGQLVSTLYTETLNSGPAFKEAFTPNGTWIAIVPPPF
jgi:hypothetical protein